MGGVMLAPRWRKMLRDIAEHPVRAMLAVLAMAAGAFGVTTTLTAYSILGRELATTYAATLPSSATLVTDHVSDDDVTAVRAVPGVLTAEARPVVSGRLRLVPDQWIGLSFWVVRDFNDLRLDTFTHDTGAWPPGPRDVFLERSALQVAGATTGDTLTVRTAYADTVQNVHLAGTVHAAGLPPAWMEHHVVGFVPWNSVLRTEPKSETAQLRFTVAEERLDGAHIASVAARVQSTLESRGRKVLRVDVPEPGRHPHAAQMDTFLYILGAFGLLTLALSAVLVANMIHALLTEQIRQVGVMKAIGARTSQIAGIYLGQVTLLASVALTIGSTLGISAGRAYAQWSTRILNAVISNDAVPGWALVAQIAVSILVPLLVAIGPVFRASRITVNQALAGDIGHRPFGTRPFDRWLARLQSLPRPLMLSLRTTFHRRGRLVLTVGSLAVGGAVLVSALNVSATWTRAVAKDYAGRHYELDVRLVRPYPIAALQATLAKVPGVARAEYWPDVAASLVNAPPGGETRFGLIAPEPGSTLIQLPILEGRWLEAHDSAAVVINQVLQARNPALHVGGMLVLRVNGHNVTWPIVGIAREIGGPSAYAPAAAVREATSESAAMSKGIRIVMTKRDDASQLEVQRAVEQALQRVDFGVLLVSRLSERRRSFEDHLVIIKSALILAASLVILVGALGLTSTLTLNVLERTRELGILNAIGATPRTISRYIVFEGVLIGVLSWMVAVIAAIPVTWALAAKTGEIFIKSSVGFFMSPTAILTWLGLVILLSAASSFYPARRSGRLAIREALAYE
jgi:putative ABC transport system permease protein